MQQGRKRPYDAARLHDGRRSGQPLPVRQPAIVECGRLRLAGRGLRVTSFAPLLEATPRRQVYGFRRGEPARDCPGQRSDASWRIGSEGTDYADADGGPIEQLPQKLGELTAQYKHTIERDLVAWIILFYINGLRCTRD
jgi:hypothetical protein